MPKLWFVVILLSASFAASIVTYPGLFGTVDNVTENDTLNVREKPDWHAKKIAELPPYADVGIDRCIRVKHATWCKVYTVNHNIGQELAYGDKLPGWVNAKYLAFSNRGYVAINGNQHKCTYALSCKGNRCRVVVDSRLKEGEVVAIQVKAYSRKQLKGIGELDITYDVPEDATVDYPCGRLSSKIDSYLKKEK